MAAQLKRPPAASASQVEMMRRLCSLLSRSSAHDDARIVFSAGIAEQLRLLRGDEPNLVQAFTQEADGTYTTSPWGITRSGAAGPDGVGPHDIIEQFTPFIVEDRNPVLSQA